MARVYVKINFAPAWILNEKVVEKIFFTDDASNKNIEEKDSHFERFSFKQQIRGTLYFRGKKQAVVQDIGFNNVDEVINKLMQQLPDTIPRRTMVQIRIENLDKNQKQDYTRMVK